MQAPRSTYISDVAILPRIHKYLEGKMDSHFIDVNLMADELQNLYYKDYGKRKRSAFRAIVKKSYGLLMKTYNSNVRMASDPESSEEEEEPDVTNNSLNNQLVDLYRVQNTKPIGENEFIDLSSDSETNDGPPAKRVANGGASTSVVAEKRLHDFKAILSPNIYPQPEMGSQSPGSSVQSNARKRKPQSEASAEQNTPRKKRVSDLEMPTTTFADIAGADSVLENICKLLFHMKHPMVYRRIGICPPRGFLLHGPPGCGKTLLANCIAGEMDIPLLKVSAPELVAGVSGESEERIRELFERATLSAPCILFIDEIDAITPNRQFAQKDMERRIVAQILTCMDDLSKADENEPVLVIGATNRPDALDPALRRAGRFDREICLGIPDTAARISILKLVTQALRLEEDFDYESLAKYTPGFVGADLVSLTREAAMVAVSRLFEDINAKRQLERAIREQNAKIGAPPNAAGDTNEGVGVGGEPVEAPATNDNGAEKPIDGCGDAVAAEAAVDDDTVVVIDDEAGKTPAPATCQPTGTNAHGIANTSTCSTLDASVDDDPDDDKLTALEKLLKFLRRDVPITADQLNTLFVTMDDFAKALKFVQPSAKREGFATVPDVTWDDVGSLREIREELQLSILAPVRHAAQFDALGLSTPTGVLLCGPPGCGKTLVAKAVANEAGINFISVKGPELLNMYVGESERAVRLCFERARNSAPCVIFFDELDALCPKRSDSREGGATMRVVNQMLTEMDGVQERRGVYLLAASNRPDIIDPAVLRPGRLDKILYVGLPTAQDRVDILRTITKNGTRPLLAADVDLELIGDSSDCEGYTGADLAALVREAGVCALREIIVHGDFSKPAIVTTEHFKRAVEKIRPSVSDKDRQHYAKLRKIYAASQPAVEEMEYS